MRRRVCFDESLLECLPKTASEWSVLFILSLHHDTERGCWPSQARIAELAGVHRKSVPRIIDHLEERGLVVRGRRRGHRMVYHLAVDERNNINPAYRPGHFAAESNLSVTAKVTCGLPKGNLGVTSQVTGMLPPSETRARLEVTQGIDSENRRKKPPKKLSTDSSRKGKEKPRNWGEESRKRECREITKELGQGIAAKTKNLISPPPATTQTSAREEETKPLKHIPDTYEQLKGGEKNE